MRLSVWDPTTLLPTAIEAMCAKTWVMWKARCRITTNAINMRPTYADPYNNRGTVRQDKGDIEGALEDYNIAIRLNPDFADPYNNRGNVRKSKGNVEGGLEDYNNAIRLSPNYVAGFYNRALLFRDQSQYKAAIADFQKYLELGGGVRDNDHQEVEGFINDLKKNLS